MYLKAHTYLFKTIPLTVFCLQIHKKHKVIGGYSFVIMLFIYCFMLYLFIGIFNNWNEQLDLHDKGTSYYYTSANYIIFTKVYFNEINCFRRLLF